MGKVLEVHPPQLLSDVESSPHGPINVGSTSHDGSLISTSLDGSLISNVESSPLVKRPVAEGAIHVGEEGKGEGKVHGAVGEGKGHGTADGERGVGGEGGLRGLISAAAPSPEAAPPPPPRPHSPVAAYD